MKIGPAIRRVRLSVDAREQLLRLKRLTGVQKWNTLARFAVSRSLAEPAPPSAAPLGEWSPLDMSFAVFAGGLEHTWLALLRQRCREDGLPTDDATVERQLHLHLHRGAAYLSVESSRGIEALVAGALAGWVTPPSAPPRPRGAE